MALNLAETAINPVAHRQLPGHGFDVHIGCLGFYCTRQNIMDQPDDRRFADAVVQALQFFIEIRGGLLQ